MAVAELLMSQRRWGHTRARRFLATVPMSESKTIGSMTDRQRASLAEHALRLHTAAHRCGPLSERTEQYRLAVLRPWHQRPAARRLGQEAVRRPIRLATWAKWRCRACDHTDRPRAQGAFLRRCARRSSSCKRVARATRCTPGSSRSVHNRYPKNRRIVELPRTRIHNVSAAQWSANGVRARRPRPHRGRAASPSGPTSSASPSSACGCPSTSARGCARRSPRGGELDTSLP